MKKSALILFTSLSICSFNNLLAYSGGSGTEADPYIIANKADILELASNTGDFSKDFKMTSDIDLDGETFTTALLDGSTDFTGTFDGNGHVVKNLLVSSTSYYSGMFGYLKGGTVKNLGIVDCDITGTYYVGGLVGSLDGGTISQCNTTGEVTGSDNNTGMLCGMNWNGTISECYSGGSVNGRIDTGGLCGLNYAIISNCYSTASVDGSSQRTGGLVGENVGSGKVIFSYSTGYVNGFEELGGLCGKNDATIDASFWDTETSEYPVSDGGVGKSTSEMQTESTFTDAGWILITSGSWMDTRSL